MDKIISNFNIEGKVTEIKALGEGFINDTLLVFVEGCEQPKYILQRKNHLVFPDVPAMMENIRKVTSTSRQRSMTPCAKPLPSFPQRTGSSTTRMRRGISGRSASTSLIP